MEKHEENILSINNAENTVDNNQDLLQNLPSTSSSITKLSDKNPVSTENREFNIRETLNASYPTKNVLPKRIKKVVNTNVVLSSSKHIDEKRNRQIEKENKAKDKEKKAEERAKRKKEMIEKRRAIEEKRKQRIASAKPSKIKKKQRLNDSFIASCTEHHADETTKMCNSLGKSSSYLRKRHSLITAFDFSFYQQINLFVIYKFLLLTFIQQKSILNGSK